MHVPALVVSHGLCRVLLVKQQLAAQQQTQQLLCSTCSTCNASSSVRHMQLQQRQLQVQQQQVVVLVTITRMRC
jgi:hypothetical protein